MLLQRKGRLKVNEEMMQGSAEMHATRRRRAQIMAHLVFKQFRV